MTTKRCLITDSFKVVKRRRRAEKRDKAPPPPPPPPPQTEPEPAPQTDREKELHELRQFDLDWKYGPSTGITRLQRWERAELHGLRPPVAIRELLLRSHTDTQYTHSLWIDYRL